MRIWTWHDTNFKVWFLVWSLWNCEFQKAAFTILATSVFWYPLGFVLRQRHVVSSESPTDPKSFLQVFWTLCVTWKNREASPWSTWKSSFGASFGVAAPKTAHHTRSDGRSYSIPADRCCPLVIRRSCGLVAMTILTVKPWIQRNLRFFFNDIHLEKRNIRIARLGCVLHLALEVWNPAPCRKPCTWSWDHLSYQHMDCLAG